MINRDYYIECRQNTEKVFADLYNHLSVYIDRYVYYQTGSKENVDDVRQEIFINLWLHWERLKSWEVQKLKNYIFIMVRNLIVTQYRIRIRNRNYHKHVSNNTMGFYKDDAIVVKEGMRVYYQAMGKLPRRQKEVFLLRDEDLSIDEIAQVLNISEHTVKNCINIASKKVKAELRKELHIKIEEDGRRKLWSMAA